MVDTIPDTSALNGHVPKTAHEKVLDECRKIGPDVEFGIKQILSRFSNLSSKEVADHLSKLAKQGALYHPGYNKYMLNPSYKTVPEKIVEMRQHVIDRPPLVGPPPAPKPIQLNLGEKSNLERILHVLKMYGEPLASPDVAKLAELAMNTTAAALVGLYKQGRVDRKEIFEKGHNGHKFLYTWVSDSIINHGAYNKPVKEARKGKPPAAATVPVVVYEEKPPEAKTSARAWSIVDAQFLSSIRSRMKLSVPATSLFTENDLEYIEGIERTIKEHLQHG